MDTPFIYDRYVTGKSFIGRKGDCDTMRNLLDAGKDIVMYEPPKFGKMSLIQQTLFNMKLSGKKLYQVQADLFNVRTLEHFLIKLASAAIRSAASTPAEYASIADKYLDGTHFIFDQDRFSSFDEVISLSGKADRNDTFSILALPDRIARERGERAIVILTDFQNILETDDPDMVFGCMENLFGEENRAATFILNGSRVNAMKYIFEERKFFYRLVERLPLGNIDDREIIEHIVKGFLYGGKVIEKELALEMCRMFKNNMWYLNHFTAICDSMTKGYINEGILLEAMKTLLSIHEPRFISAMDNLTLHQISLLKAIIDGVVRLSSAECIESYGLNSPANVRRVKDALKKKEIITFNEKDEPVFLDPLFEYWVTKYYF